MGTAHIKEGGALTGGGALRTEEVGTAHIKEGGGWVSRQEAGYTKTRQNEPCELMGRGPGTCDSGHGTMVGECEGPRT